MGMNSPGSVSLDVNCLKVSLSRICLLLLGSPKPPSPPHTLLSTAGLCSGVASAALCPHSAHAGICSESDLPKPWSELSRSWLGTGPLLTPLPLARLLAMVLSLPFCAHASATPVCLMDAQSPSASQERAPAAKSWCCFGADTSGKRRMVLLVLSFFDDRSSTLPHLTSMK